MKKAFTNMILLDGSENMAPLSGYAVLVDGENIAAVLPETECDFQ